MRKRASMLRGPLACLSLLLCLSPAGGVAQGTRTQRARTWPIDSVLAHFEVDMRHRVVNSMANEVAFSIIYLSEGSTARKDSLLDGLERLALSSDDGFVRSAAAGRIAFAGEGGTNWHPLRGVMARLVRIYHTTAHPDVRLTILDALPLQSDRRPALAFLRSVASAPDSTNNAGGPHEYFSFGDPRTRALTKLTEMGEDGRAALQAMYRSREIGSVQGRIWMEEYARSGFPVSDVRARLHP